MSVFHQGVKQRASRERHKLNCYVPPPEMKGSMRPVALLTCSGLKKLLLNITVTKTQQHTNQTSMTLAAGRLQGLSEPGTRCVARAMPRTQETRRKEAVVPWKWPWHWLSAVLQSRAVPSSLPVSRRCPSGLRLSQLMPPR